MIQKDHETHMIQQDTPRRSTGEKQPDTLLANDSELAELQHILNHDIEKRRSRTLTYCVPDSDFEQPINSLGILPPNVHAAAGELERCAGGKFGNSVFYVVTDVGYEGDSFERKTTNDDAYLVIPESQTIIVYDGVSGTERDMGRVAAAIGVYIASFEMQSSTKLEEGFHLMHSGVQRYRKNNPHNPNTAACAVGARLVEDVVQFANVGDCKGLVLRKDEAVFSTEDDNELNAKLARSGDIDLETALAAGIISTPESIRLGSCVTQALGHFSNLHHFKSEERFTNINPHSIGYQVQSNDIVLLCSDGLTSVLTEEEIAQFIYFHIIFEKCSLADAIEELKEFVLTKMKENKYFGDNLVIGAFQVA